MCTKDAHFQFVSIMYHQTYSIVMENSFNNVLADISVANLEMVKPNEETDLVVCYARYADDAFNI